MNDKIQAFRARLATVSPAKAQTIRELIETLEADEPTTVTRARAITLTAAQKDNPFLNRRAKWVPADDRTRAWAEGLTMFSKLDKNWKGRVFHFLKRFLSEELPLIILMMAVIVVPLLCLTKMPSGQ